MTYHMDLYSSRILCFISLRFPSHPSGGGECKVWLDIRHAKTPDVRQTGLGNLPDSPQSVHTGIMLEIRSRDSYRCRATRSIPRSLLVSSATTLSQEKDLHRRMDCGWSWNTSPPPYADIVSSQAQSHIRGCFEHCRISQFWFGGYGVLSKCFSRCPGIYRASSTLEKTRKDMPSFP
jgi:hypothetical protein